MTTISLNTVGFGEVRPLSDAGQWFTIAFLMLGSAFAGFAVAGITAFVVQGELRNMLKGRRLDRQILQLSDHYILYGCGAGAPCAEPGLSASLASLTLCSEDVMIALGSDAQLAHLRHLAASAS